MFLLINFRENYVNLEPPTLVYTLNKIKFIPTDLLLGYL